MINDSTKEISSHIPKDNFEAILLLRYRVSDSIYM